jgi:hypothetical protein
MKTILEIFYLRIVGKSVRYQRRQTNLDRRESDPDRLIWSLIRQKGRSDAGQAEEEEFVVHSTSWRYEKPGKILLTYIAYSDELEFPEEKFQSLPLSKIRTITKNSRKPRSRRELENKVVSHGMRHIAFLIQTGDQEDFKSALQPETAKVFERLWISLAGKIFR